MGSAYEGDRDFLAKLEASGPAVHNQVDAVTVTVLTVVTAFTSAPRIRASRFIQMLGAAYA